MDLPAKAVNFSRNRDCSSPNQQDFELSTKTVDNFVDFFLTLASSHGLVRILSLCRNIEQHHLSFKFSNLNKQRRVKGFSEFILLKKQNSVHK
jgi:hypothetical protein